MFGIHEGDSHGLLGQLKGAVERFEMRLLDKDAVVQAPALAALDPQIGSWQGQMSTWLMPGAPADVQPVTSTAQWILGGKFLERTFDGSFFGKPFAARCFIGHDDAADQYESAWMDSATTSMLQMRGSHDPGTETLTLNGSFKLVNVAGTSLDLRTEMAMNGADMLRVTISIGRMGIYVKAHQIDMTRVTTP